LSRGDLGLLRQAANHDWCPPQAIRHDVARIIHARLARLAGKESLDRRETRWFLAAAEATLAMDRANLRLLDRVLQASAMARR
jgi:hypothetical protein